MRPILLLKRAETKSKQLVAREVAVTRVVEAQVASVAKADRLARPEEANNADKAEMGSGREVQEDREEWDGPEVSMAV